MAPIASALYALQLRLPDEFVDLEAEAGVEIVGEHPLGERAGIEQAIFGGASACGSLAKGGREDQSGGVGIQAVGANEVTGVLVILARGEDELELVAGGEGGEVFRTEAQMLAAGGTFDIDNFVNLAGNEFEGTLAAGFEQHSEVEGEKLMHEGDQLALLQHGLSTGDFDEAAAGREALNFKEQLRGGDFTAAGEGVLGVTPGTAEIASGEAHEDAGQTREGTFTLQRFVDFDDVHRGTRFQGFAGFKVSRLNA